MRSAGPVAIAVAFLALVACPESRDEGGHRLTGPRNFVSGYPSLNADGTVNAVIEIPAGTTAKWETLHDGTAIEWEAEAGGRPGVRYLPDPGQDGLGPGTRLPPRVATRSSASLAGVGWASSTRLATRG